MTGVPIAEDKNKNLPLFSLQVWDLGKGLAMSQVWVSGVAVVALSVLFSAGLAAL